MKVTLPWPGRALHPNARVHWAQKAKATARYRRDCCLVAQVAGARALGWPAMTVRIEFRPPDRRRRDIDGMLAAIKSGLDGLADATGVDDSAWQIAIVKGEPTPGGAVEITVGEEALEAMGVRLG